MHLVIAINGGVPLICFLGRADQHAILINKRPTLRPVGRRAVGAMIFAPYNVACRCCHWVSLRYSNSPIQARAFQLAHRYSLKFHLSNPPADHTRPACNRGQCAAPACHLGISGIRRRCRDRCRTGLDRLCRWACLIKTRSLQQQSPEAPGQ
ncbi:MAG: hypothetical protein [Caudoviricetes sp.]|nr:MAG: hypothetical protein [Caudoviricetes sp.]